MSTTIDNFDSLVESTFEHDEPWKNPDLLHHLYWDRDMTQGEIASELGCDQTTISRWMDKLDVSSRDSITVSHHIEERDGDLGYSKWNNNHTTVMVHRLVAVAEYGFDAVCDKVVHHRNECKFDNRISNLELMTRSQHNTLHN